MLFETKDLFKRVKENSELEESFNILKENLIYGQQLARIGSWTYDIKTGETFWTEEVYHILGCCPQDLDGKLQNFLPYVHPDDLERVKKVTQEAIKGKEYAVDY